jgi:hypothetical protein
MGRSESQVLLLNKGWEFRQGEVGEWQPISVPGCWEQLGVSHDWEGEGWYRQSLTLNPIWRAQFERLWLRFGAVSYFCEVFVNGQKVGEHQGAWDAFSFEVTDVFGESLTAEISVRVIKPGGETFPTKQTTAGFLPYVWGFLFGGIWQEVTLEGTGAFAIPEGLNLEELQNVPLSKNANLSMKRIEGSDVFWSPENPALDTWEVSVKVDGVLSDRQILRTGRREVTVQGSQILLNGRPCYLRMPLSWGWYPAVMHCNPPVETFRAELEKLRALGYNGFKSCLWVPPPAFLDLCDEMGILVWLELPLWLPEMNEGQWERTFTEYEAIVRQVRHHPCIVVWTLGCELSTACPDAFLQRLYLHAKQLTGSPLVRDNSGGGECYGGLLKEYADYYDYHFYCDLHFLRNTFDYFLPHWRPSLPWLFGEFCDADAFRDLIAIQEAHGGTLPWWTQDSEEANPQGVRWDMHILHQWEFMERHGLFAHREALKTSQQKQTLLHRKFTIEKVRSYPNMSGYVVTGLVDTPISIAGMWDDFGELRYSPEEFCPFNGDTVLFVGWHRRRNWNAGGDRPSYIDTNCWWEGEVLLPRLGFSHFGKETRILSAKFTLLCPKTEEIFSESNLTIEAAEVVSGTVQQVGMGELSLPNFSTMMRVVLEATACLEGVGEVKNRWSLWAVPKPKPQDLPSWVAYDPLHVLTGLERNGLQPTAFVTPQEIEQCSVEESVLFASQWTPEIEAWVAGGGRALVYLNREGGVPVFEAPFWREAMKLFHAHPVWNSFAHEDWTDLQFYGLAPDCALALETLSATIPNLTWKPLLRRVDARTMDVTEYLVEGTHASGGRVLFTTLRPQGGLGDQPDGLWRNVGGVQFLVACLTSLSSCDSGLA